MKTPPHSIEAEQSVLGGLLLDNSRHLEIADDISEGDFYRQDHRLLWREISALIDHNSPCDLLTLVERLKGIDQLENAGGFAYIASLASDTPSSANVAAYARIVRQKAILRALLKTTFDIAASVHEPDGRTADELLGIAEEKVLQVRRFTDRGNRAYRSLPDLLESVHKLIEKTVENKGLVAGLETGFKDLDRLTTGFHPGDLVIIGARPSMGKTSLALNMAEHAAINLKKAVGVFSMEMPGEQLALRILASAAKIGLGKLRSGYLSDQEMDRLVSSHDWLSKAQILVDETGSLSPADLKAKARRMKRDHNIGLIVVDYIQLMQVPSIRDNRTNEIAAISRELKALAKELALPIIALSQLNRGVEQQGGRKPQLSDLRESGGIEQDADLVILIHREKPKDGEVEPNSVAELIIAKQRNGPLATVKTMFLGPYTRFENLAYDDQAA